MLDDGMSGTRQKETCNQALDDERGVSLGTLCLAPGGSLMQRMCAGSRAPITEQCCMSRARILHAPGSLQWNIVGDLRPYTRSRQTCTELATRGSSSGSPGKTATNHRSGLATRSSRRTLDLAIGRAMLREAGASLIETGSAGARGVYDTYVREIAARMRVSALQGVQGKAACSRTFKPRSFADFARPPIRMTSQGRDTSYVVRQVHANGLTA